MGYGELGYYPPTPTLTPYERPCQTRFRCDSFSFRELCFFFSTKSYHRWTFADRVQLQR